MNHGIKGTSYGHTGPFVQLLGMSGVFSSTNRQIEGVVIIHVGVPYTK